MFNIGILTACESERHLSEPVFTEIQKLGMNPVMIELTQNNIVDSYHRANFRFKRDWNKTFEYNFVLAVGDRPEQMGGVLSAFQNKIPLGHLYAGDLNTIATFDDTHRHAITLYSDIQFCSSKEACVNVERIKRSAGLVSNADFVGATHFDNIDKVKIEQNKVWFSDYLPYILVLINSETIGDDDKLIEDTITQCMKTCTKTIPNFLIAKGNGDSDKIENTLFKKLSESLHTNIKILTENRINHLYFLSMIANCDYFISNSSCVIYEAPNLIKRNKIIQVGNRNKGRTQVPLIAHNGYASFSVAQLIKAFLQDKEVIK